jgi:hypothetical protein
VGLDIELVTPKIEKIAHKFVADSEWRIIGNRELGIGNWDAGVQGVEAVDNSKEAVGESTLSTRQRVNCLTLLWSCKEALFKWYGLGEVGFIRHMELKQVVALDEHQYELGFHFKKEKDLLLGLHSRFFNELILSYVAT